jgi:hypothetical protein
LLEDGKKHFSGGKSRLRKEKVPQKIESVARGWKKYPKEGKYTRGRIRYL